MYFFKNISEKNSKIFKKRYCKHGIYIKKKKNCIFLFKRKLVCMSTLKFFFYRLKKLYKRKKINIFIFIKKNHFISQKPKNTRMGKGKGKFLKTIFFQNKKPIISIPEISKSRLLTLNKYLRFKNRFTYI